MKRKKKPQRRQHVVVPVRRDSMPCDVMALDMMREMLKSRAQFEQAMWQMFAMVFVEPRPMMPVVGPRLRKTVGVACEFCSAQRGDLCDHLVDDAVPAT